MKNYLDITALEDIPGTLQEALVLKRDPNHFHELGKYKTLVMIFFNASLRTRLSTEKAARHLGMDVMVLNVNDTWNLELNAGSVMKFGSAEHIKDAARVISQYADVIAVRAFADLKDRDRDRLDLVLRSFEKYASVPVVNMESALGHPLQALADAITISELKTTQKPKVVLSWAPHPKALPHAVPNSFVRMMRALDMELVITHPTGYELDPEITGDTPVVYDQQQALADADFVYVKNWCSYQDYGKVLHKDPSWMMTKEKLGSAFFMHCLPVRRNVVVEDAILDGDQSVVIRQAANRTVAAQIVLKKILENL